MANSVKSSKKSSVASSDFNNWEFVKGKLVQEYLEQGRPNEFTVNFKFMDDYTSKDKKFHAEGARKVLDYFESLGAYEYSKPRMIVEKVDEDTSKVYWTVKIENFDLHHQSYKKDGDGTFFTFRSAYQNAMGLKEFYEVKA